MSELKTRKTDASVEEFLEGVGHEKRREDCRRVVEMMREVTGSEPAMWGASIIGFGEYRYKYPTGREGDWFLTGVSPRKQALTLYITAGFQQYDELLDRLGKFRTGESCLYVKKLEDVDLDVLRELVRRSTEYMAEKYVEQSEPREGAL